MIAIPGAVVDNLEVKIVLPEGATWVPPGLSNIHVRHDFYRDIEVTTPYPSRALWLDKQVTYLDTIGRPAIMFEYKDLTIKHAQNIYVSSIVMEFSCSNYSRLI